MRIFLTSAAYLGALVVVSVVAFLAVIVLAGPHGGLLPPPFEGVVLILGWIAVLALPIWAARVVWRRSARLRR